MKRTKVDIKRASATIDATTEQRVQTDTLEDLESVETLLVFKVTGGRFNKA